MLRLCRTFCFLPRLLSAKNDFPPRVAAGSRIMQTVSTGSLFFYWTVISAGSRFTREAKLTDSLSRRENWRTTILCVICHLQDEGKNSKCGYCLTSFPDANSTLRHCVKKHPNDKLCLFWPLRNAEENLINYKTGIFDVFSSSLQSNAENIQFINNKVSIQTRIVTQSPIQKIRRINTPTKTVHWQLFDEYKSEKQNESVTSDTYSRTSVARTLVDRLPRLFRTLF